MAEFYRWERVARIVFLSRRSDLRGLRVILRVVAGIETVEAESYSFWGRDSIL